MSHTVRVACPACHDDDAIECYVDYEPPDPSVGLFGESWDAMVGSCDHCGKADWTEPEQDAIQLAAEQQAERERDDALESRGEDREREGTDR